MLCLSLGLVIVVVVVLLVGPVARGRGTGSRNMGHYVGAVVAGCSEVASEKLSCWTGACWISAESAGGRASFVTSSSVTGILSGVVMMRIWCEMSVGDVLKTARCEWVCSTRSPSPGGPSGRRRDSCRSRPSLMFFVF